MNYRIARNTGVELNLAVNKICLVLANSILNGKCMLSRVYHHYYKVLPNIMTANISGYMVSKTVMK